MFTNVDVYFVYSSSLENCANGRFLCQDSLQVNGDSAVALQDINLQRNEREMASTQVSSCDISQSLVTFEAEAVSSVTKDLKLMCVYGFTCTPTCTYSTTHVHAHVHGKNMKC